MNQEQSDIFEICLQRMEQGESLESILAQYPDLASSLRYYLETTTRVRSLSHGDISPAVIARQRARFLAQATELKYSKAKLLPKRIIWRPAVIVLSLLAFLVVSGNGLLIASAHSLPGDSLYTLKRSVETTQLRLVSDPAKRQDLENTFNERRVDETKSLIDQQRVETVEFTGFVLSQMEHEWQVSGILVQITDRTIIDNVIAKGDEVDVYGETGHNGVVEAIRLSLTDDFESEHESPEFFPSQTPDPGNAGESDLNENPSHLTNTTSPTNEGQEKAHETQGPSTETHEQDHSSSDNSQPTPTFSGSDHD